MNITDVPIPLDSTTASAPRRSDSRSDTRTDHTDSTYRRQLAQTLQEPPARGASDDDGREPANAASRDIPPATVGGQAADAPDAVHPHAPPREEIRETDSAADDPAIEEIPLGDAGAVPVTVTVMAGELTPSVPVTQSETASGAVAALSPNPESSAAPQSLQLVSASPLVTGDAAATTPADSPAAGLPAPPPHLFRTPPTTAPERPANTAATPGTSNPEVTIPQPPAQIAVASVPVRRERPPAGDVPTAARVPPMSDVAGVDFAQSAGPHQPGQSAAIPPFVPRPADGPATVPTAEFSAVSPVGAARVADALPAHDDTTHRAEPVRAAAAVPGAESTSDTRPLAEPISNGPPLSAATPAAPQTGHVPSAGTPSARDDGSGAVNAHNARELTDRVAHAVRSAESGPRELRLRLNPPELGALQVEVSSRGGVVTARLEVETAAAQRVILDSLPLLHDALGQQGMTLARIDVGVAEPPRDGAASNAARDGGHQRPQDQESHRRDQEREPSRREPPDRRRTPRPRRHSMEQIDIDV